MALDDFYTRLSLGQLFKDDEWVDGEHFSDAVDTTGFHQALVLLNVGTVGRSGAIQCHIDESADAGSSDPWTEVPGSDFPTINENNDDSAFMGRVLLGARKRYIRFHLTLTGHDSFLGGIILLDPYDTSNSTDFAYGI